MKSMAPTFWLWRSVRVLVVFVAAATLFFTSSRADDLTQTKGTMRIRAVDADGTPVAGAKIHSSVWTDEPGFKANQDYTCGSDGITEIKLPRKLTIFRLWARGQGYAAMFVGWERGAVPAVPDEFTFHLCKATTMGGIIVDEDGKPIQGAKVEVEYEKGGEKANKSYREGFDRWLANGDGALITDEQGRWRIDNAPPGDNVQVRVIPSHADYISLETSTFESDDKRLPSKELRNESATLTLKRGIGVTGKITDAEGKPVAGAAVMWDDAAYRNHQSNQEVSTDQNGAYHFPPLPPGRTRVTVVAVGSMPQMRTIEIAQGMPSTDFQLNRGKNLRIRVLDTDGKPISKASFQIRSWGNSEWLFGVATPNALSSRAPQHTDENGIYEWTWAPADAVTFKVSGPDDYCSPEVSFTANDQEHVLTLLPVLKIEGSVTDRKTGQPIERFYFMDVLQLGPTLACVERQDVHEGSSGRYSLTGLDRTDTAYRVRIEADGYRTTQSDVYRVGQANPQCNFQLEPADAAHGRILGTDGKPAAGVTVFLATASQQLDLFNLEHNQGVDNFSRKTDERGEFSFPAQFERYIVIAFNDSGYAEALLKPEEVPGEMHLQKWACVEGRLLQEGQPVADATVQICPWNSRRYGDLPSVREECAIQTDQAGRFVFPRVPPIKCALMPDLSPWQDYKITSACSVPLDLQPGQRVSIDLGGDADVTGRVVLNGKPATDFDYNYSMNYLLRKSHGIDPPADLNRNSFDWQKGWSDAFPNTSEGIAYLNTLHHYFVKLNHDGNFLICGVPPGDYDLALRVYERPTGCLVDPIGSKVFSFRVPPTQSKAKPFDLGTIEIEASIGPKPGEIVPDFEFQTFDGRKKKLSDLYGKPVLIDFWATWCQSCVAGLSDVQRLYEKFGHDGRLTVVSIAVDDDRADLVHFIQEHKLPWMQAYAGSWRETKLLQKLGISSVPAYLLIGPDGKLIESVNTADDLSDRITMMLKSPPDSAKK